MHPTTGLSPNCWALVRIPSFVPPPKKLTQCRPTYFHRLFHIASRAGVSGMLPYRTGRNRHHSARGCRGDSITSHFTQARPNLDLPSAVEQQMLGTVETLSEGMRTSQTASEPSQTASECCQAASECFPAYSVSPRDFSDIPRTLPGSVRTSYVFQTTSKPSRDRFRI